MILWIIVKLQMKFLDIDEQVEAFKPKVAERTSRLLILIAAISYLIISGYLINYPIISVLLILLNLASTCYVVYLHIKLYRLMRKVIKLSKQLPDEE